MATFLQFQPAPDVPASAQYELCLSSQSKPSAGTDFARFSVVRDLPQLPFEAFTGYRPCPHQRGTSFPSAPIPSFQPVPSLSASAQYELAATPVSGLQSAPSFFASARYELATAPIQTLNWHQASFFLLRQRQPSQAANSERSGEFDVLVYGIVRTFFALIFPQSTHGQVQRALRVILLEFIRQFCSHC